MCSEYKVRKVQAKNVAIGSHARANHTEYITAEHSREQAEALEQIRQLLELLPAHLDEIDSPRSVKADAEAAEDALSKKKLNRARIENLIGKITAGLAGVTALANAVDAVQTAVTRLFT